MHNRLVSKFALGCMTALTLACGGDGDVPDNADAGPDAGLSFSIDDICDQNGGGYIALFQTMFDCYPEFALFLGELPDTSELAALCTASIQPYLDDGTSELGVYADFEACMTYIDGLTCDQAAFDVPNPCDSVITGLVDFGGLCDDSAQCSGAAYCDNADGTACGSCTAKKADDAGCFGNEECVNGNCSGYDDESPLLAGTCKTYGGLGDDCEINQDCLGTTVCDRAQTPSKCAAEPAWIEGTTCYEFTDCELTGDLYCSSIFLDNGSAGTCARYAEIGEACGDPNNGGALCRIFEFEHCADAGGGQFQCMAPTLVAPTDGCSAFRGLKCPDNYRCVGEQGQNLGFCVEQLGVGGDCSAPLTQCAGFLECVDDTCQYGKYTGMCPASS